MKTSSLITTLALASALTATLGCGKKEEVPPPTAVEKATGAAGAALQDAAAAAKATAEKAVTEVSKQADAVAANATAKAQELIDKAKALTGDKKYQDALALLKQLGDYKLTPEQQKLVADLKATITAGLGSSGVGNLLNK